MRPCWNWSAITKPCCEDKLKETRARSEAGELTGTDMRQAESRLARAHVSRYQAESTLTQDRASFARLVGNAPEQLQAPALALDSPRTLADIFHVAETHNPDVIAAQFAVEEADAEIRLNKGSLLPEVDLVGNTSAQLGPEHHASGTRGFEPGSGAADRAALPLRHRLFQDARGRADRTASGGMSWTKRATRRMKRADNAWQALMTAQAALDADKAEVDAAAAGA